jgi:hypothetical protein
MKIRIRQYAFEISTPYSSGHVLTDLEAQALNALRAENIRNNMSKVVQRELNCLGEGEALPSEVLADLTARITNYDKVYSFSPRFAAASPALFEAACIEIADALQRDPSDEVVRTEASKRLAARARVAKRTAEEMGL